MSAEISFHGALFDSGSDITPAIAKAANIAKTYGLAIVRARTPVDTSQLKSSWRANLEGNGIRYTNSAPYAGFVENGTSRMSGRHMLADSLTDIETVFYQELSREVGKQLAFDIIDVADKPDYSNAVKTDNPTKYPKVGDTVAPKQKTGLTKRTYSKKYLFANPTDIVRKSDKIEVNASRPRWQKNKRVFKPEFKVR